MLIYKRCGCEVRPPQTGGAHTCACALKSGRARCVRATQKRVATHTLVISRKTNYEFSGTFIPISLFNINKTHSDLLEINSNLIFHFSWNHVMSISFGISSKKFKTNMRLWVAKINLHTHTCAHTRTCAMCVRKAFWGVRAMCVRAALFRPCDVRSHFSTLFVANTGNKWPYIDIFCNY